MSILSVHSYQVILDYTSIHQVFGIPQVGCMDMQGNYLENHTLEPDVLIYNEPAASLKGEDAQLKAAVDCLLKELPKK